MQKKAAAGTAKTPLLHAACSIRKGSWILDMKGGVTVIGKMLTVRELASLLNVPASWVYSRTGKGVKDKIPHIRVGKYIRFPEEMVREFVEKHKNPAESG